MGTLPCGDSTLLVVRVLSDKASVNRMIKWVVALALICSVAFAADASRVAAHSGGLDGQGGHNCNVGSCRGTYHCHQPRGPRCQPSSTSGSVTQSRVTPSVCVSAYTSTLSRSDVARIQTALRSKGFSPGPIDGYYGSMTRSALNRFESGQRIPQSTGSNLRDRSLRQLGVVCGVSAAPTPAQSTSSTTCIPGRGTVVKAQQGYVKVIQRRLATLGYRPGPADGIYGPVTRAAVNAFEADGGLTRSSAASINANTLNRLFIRC